MPEERSQILALFDFDGTLTRKDTLIALIKFIHGKRLFYQGILTMAPYLFLYKIRIIPNWKAKEKVLSHFFKGMSCKVFQDHCNRFAREIIPTLLRESAIVKMNQLKENGATVIIVTASAENWMLPWCSTLNIDCIASKMEEKAGRLTGRLNGKNCFGTEKVRRIKESVDLSKYNVIYAYGDSKGDRPMLKLATKPFYRTL